MSKCCFSFKRQMVDIEQPFVNFFKIFFFQTMEGERKTKLDCNLCALHFTGTHNYIHCEEGMVNQVNASSS